MKDLSGCSWQRGAGAHGTRRHRQGITYGEHLWSGTTNHQGLLNVKVGKWAGCFSQRARSPISSEMWEPRLTGGLFFQRSRGQPTPLPQPNLSREQFPQVLC